MKKLQIKAVIFDVGGVLALGKYSPESRHYQSRGIHGFIAQKLKISIDQWFDTIDSTYADGIEGKISESKFVSIIAKNNKVTSKKISKLYIKAYKKLFKINKGLYKFAFRLKKKCYKIAILSDQHYLSEKVLMPERFVKKFDVSIVSCDVGMRKPNPEIYKLTLKKLNIPAQNTVFVDNQDWNLKPAKKLKINTILFKNNKQAIRDLEKLGVKI